MSQRAYTVRLLSTPNGHTLAALAMTLMRSHRRIACLKAQDYAMMQLQQRITTGGTGDGRFALQKSMSAHVSHGSIATEIGWPRDVRFAPKATV
jgi:hypothetical protein